MTADILDALATYLTSDELPVYYFDLPTSKPKDVSELTQFAVVTPGGHAHSAGDNSYIKVARLRADVWCYGAGGYLAMKTYRTLEERMKELVPTTVTVGPAGERVGVRLHNATYVSGPNSIVDQATSWPVLIGTWGVHGSEIEIALGMFSSMFSEMFS